MSSTFKISVIIPTLNEAKNLRILLPLLFSNNNKELIEVIVADANSTDQTRLVSEQLGAKFVLCSLPSRAAQMNAAAKISIGEVLYFVHADTRTLPGFTEDIKSSISNGHLVGCYRYQFDSDNYLLCVSALLHVWVNCRNNQPIEQPVTKISPIEFVDEFIEVIL